MENTSENRKSKLVETPTRYICLGILAHVDAGKTTLSEAMLFQSGSIRKAGRVDNGDAFLDTHALERARGITIFSKQAVFQLGEKRVTLLDTPGHVDFSAEMERTLQVLDYAVLVISGTDGVQGHTKTLWRLLKRYQIPVFLFVNKMDLDGACKGRLMQGLLTELDESCVDFTEAGSAAFYESVALCGETALSQYLEQGRVEDQEIRRLILKRRLFPCYFGSALKLAGVRELLQGISVYMEPPRYPAEFGARVFKIARDGQGNRLTFLKVTGGSLGVKMQLSGQKKDSEELWTEKVNQVRLYSGEKYETTEEAEAGSVCAVTGLAQTYPGEGLGSEEKQMLPALLPVLNYRLILPEGCDAAKMMKKLRELEEEEPQLHIVWNEKLQEIQAQLMGEVQTEILKSLIWERFGVDVSFDTGNIVYKETITKTVEGVGHFEPLRHYAEVHLLLEPGENGSGLVFASDCSEDVLAKNWQHLVVSQLEEKEHIGVLTGAPITDMKVTLVSGRAHIKHTEGGDFGQAAFRALRQGLMQAEPVLLEPYYDFLLEIPQSAVGRAMTDIERMGGMLSCEGVSGDFRQLSGAAPVAKMRNYQIEVNAYTRGQGKLTCSFGGYRPCKDAERVIEEIGYDPQRDIENPTGSVFCAHGAGFTVEWDRVAEYMHLAGRLLNRKPEASEGDEPGRGTRQRTFAAAEAAIGTEEIDRILNRTYNANKRDKGAPEKNGWKLKGRGGAPAAASPVVESWRPKRASEEYLLVDGYNIIFAWEELKELAVSNIDGARGRLLDILCNYQGITGCNLIVVFDAYRVAGHRTEALDYHNIHVVYTREAETADQYIEKFAHENGRKYHVTVATSDGLEQIIIRGSGCSLLSARELFLEVTEKNRQIQENYQETQTTGRACLLDRMPEEALRQEGREVWEGEEESGQ